jgi:hypothetical protein
MKSLLKIIVMSLIVGCISSVVWSQPGPVPAGANANCGANPGTDTLPYIPDAEGFSSLFDGVSSKGWWESCKSGHTNSGDKLGGTWLVDPTLKAIFSAQKSDGSGSLFMTNQKFGNYEIILDIWPDFGNDGGVFNRTTQEGDAYQTTIDYIGGSSVGGSYAEGIKDASGGAWNTDPVKFGANESSVTVQTDNSWTVLTKANQPATYGCPVNGCTAAEWTKVWDIAGWNQLRIKFYGGLTSANNQTHMEVWIRDLKTADKPWVPMLNQVKTMVLPANFIALQIHKGTSRWGGAAGDWYRNIKLRPLTDAGVPIGVVGINQNVVASPESKLDLLSTALVGIAQGDYSLTVRDVNGKIVDVFAGKAGRFQHSLSNTTKGILFVEFKTPRGAYQKRINRF